MKHLRRLAVGAIACLMLTGCAKAVGYEEFHEEAQKAAKAGHEFTKAVGKISGDKEDGSKYEEKEYTFNVSSLAGVKGWIPTEINATSTALALFIAATADSVPEDSAYKYFVGGGFKVEGEQKDEEEGTSSKVTLEYNDKALLTKETSEWTNSNGKGKFVVTFKYSK